MSEYYPQFETVEEEALFLRQDMRTISWYFTDAKALDYKSLWAIWDGTFNINTGQIIQHAGKLYRRYGRSASDSNPAENPQEYYEITDEPWDLYDSEKVYNAGDRIKVRSLYGTTYYISRIDNNTSKPPASSSNSRWYWIGPYRTDNYQ